MVYAYNEQAATDCSPKSIYITTLFKEGMENKFIIPSSFIDETKIVVYKKPNIKLLTDIKFNSEYFDIDSDNIKLPSENELGYMFINDDKVFFKSIFKF